MSPWTTELVYILRVLIDDFATPQKNSDTYLQRVLVAAGVFVDQDIALAQDYVFDVGNVTITPDPCLVGDDIAKALLPLRAACILNVGKYTTAISQGIRVQDGDSQVDTSVGFRGFFDIIKMGACATYASMLFAAQSDGVATVGNAVMGPVRLEGECQGRSISWFWGAFADWTRRERA